MQNCILRLFDVDILTLANGDGVIVRLDRIATLLAGFESSFNYMNSYVPKQTSDLRRATRNVMFDGASEDSIALKDTHGSYRGCIFLLRILLEVFEPCRGRKGEGLNKSLTRA